MQGPKDSKKKLSSCCKVRKNGFFVRGIHGTDGFLLLFFALPVVPCTKKYFVKRLYNYHGKKLGGFVVYNTLLMQEVK